MVIIDLDKLEDLFSYHNPENNEVRKAEHSKMNEICANFGVEIAKIIGSKPDELTNILRQIQMIRMLGNQAITFKHENIDYRDIFVEGDND